MKTIAAYVANTIHQVLTHPESPAVMLVETDVYTFNMTSNL